jgi:hypothetical protein
MSGVVEFKEYSRVRIPSSSVTKFEKFLHSIPQASWIHREETDLEKQKEDLKEYMESYERRVKALKEPQDPETEASRNIGYNYLAAVLANSNNTDLLDDSGVELFKEILVDQIFLECTKQEPERYPKAGDHLSLTRWHNPILSPREVITIVTRYGLEYGFHKKLVPYHLVSEEFGTTSDGPARQAEMKALGLLRRPENRRRLEPTGIFTNSPVLRYY